MVRHGARLFFAPFFALLTVFITATSFADTLVVSGTIYTADDANTQVEAVVIEDGRFTFVGDLATAQSTAGEDHRHISLGAATAYPGFIESHGHLSSLGEAITNLDLNGVDSYQTIVGMVADAAAKASPGQVIKGRGWHQSKWSKEPSVTVDGFPTHRSLSEVSPNNPVFLGHANGHTALVNQAAMDALNLTYNTPTPDGGVIVKDGKGDPTGILHENAIDLAYPLIALSTDSAKTAILAAQDHAFRWGITNFHDAGAGSTDIEAQRALDASGDLKLRVYTMVSAQDEALTDYWLARPPVIADDDSRLTIRSFKAVMDGALGSRTAWLHQPYTDDPGTSGVQTFDENRLVNIMNRSNAHGWQINTHAIGDKANTVVLDAIDKATLTQRDHRSRIEHSQHLLPSDIERFSTLGVIASIQAIHMSSDRPWAIDRLGKERIESGAYVWRDLLNAGVNIANGTDVPVEPINPIANFYASVARKTLKGLPDDGYEIGQKLSRHETLKSMTLWNAYAAFEEAEVGSISVGKRADMTVTDQNLMTVDETKILATKPVMTIVGGEIVYQAM
ncbi:MAG: amidohydrolase [Pseudomonadota bacterium]|nr:amidohydrolase [Pseudomonadota bacterium]MED5539058.1 amidohydrolase [Pseudomonadota bacterium]